MRKHWKILSLSILALTAAMAVNASSAQAMWVLDGGTTIGEELLLNVPVTAPLGYLAIGGLNVVITCHKGNGTAHFKTLEKMKKLDVKVNITFTECLVLGFTATCTVKSKGAKAGEIVASGEGSGNMDATNTYGEATSSEFTTILFEGEECPFNEESGAVNGTVKVTSANTDIGTLALKHSATVDDVTLKWGAEKAELYGSETNKATPLTVEGTAEGGGNWAILLTGL